MSLYSELTQETTEKFLLAQSPQVSPLFSISVTGEARIRRLSSNSLQTRSTFAWLHVMSQTNILTVGRGHNSVEECFFARPEVLIH